MQILLQKVEAKKVIKMINARLDNITLEYVSAKGMKDSTKAEALAETKWQLAELKMQFVDLLVRQLEDEPELTVTN